MLETVQQGRSDDANCARVRLGRVTPVLGTVQQGRNNDANCARVCLGRESLRRNLRVLLHALDPYDRHPLFHGLALVPQQGQPLQGRQLPPQPTAECRLPLRHEAPREIVSRDVPCPNRASFPDAWQGRTSCAPPRDNCPRRRPLRPGAPRACRCANRLLRRPACARIQVVESPTTHAPPGPPSPRHCARRRWGNTNPKCNASSAGVNVRVVIPENCLSRRVTVSSPGAPSVRSKKHTTKGRV